MADPTNPWNLQNWVPVIQNKPGATVPGTGLKLPGFGGVPTLPNVPNFGNLPALNIPTFGTNSINLPSLPTPVAVGTAVGTSISQQGLQQTVTGVESDIHTASQTLYDKLKSGSIWVVLVLILIVGVYGLIAPSGSNEVPVPIPA